MTREWAVEELRYAGYNLDKPADQYSYEEQCAQYALEVLDLLSNQGHSGFSVGVTMSLVNKLFRQIPLTELTNNPEDWINISEDDTSVWVHKRRRSLHKYIDENQQEYFVDYAVYHCYNINQAPENRATWTSSLISKLLCKLHPIQFPYRVMPDPIWIGCEEVQYDASMGDFDTIHVVCEEWQNGDRFKIDVYYKESETGFIEISKEEYDNRREHGKVLY